MWNPAHNKLGKRGRTNGRCTGNNTNCTQRCNISTKEDLYRKHSSSTCTQEDNGGSHGCYQHTHPIDDTIVRYNGPFHGNHGSPKGPSQGHSCSHTVRSENGPFQGHHVQTGNTVVSPKKNFSGHSCSPTVYSETGPFQDHHVQTRTTVVYPKGPFQGHSCSPTVRSENGPFQGHHVQTGSTASETNDPANYSKLVHCNAQ